MEKNNESQDLTEPGILPPAKSAEQPKDQETASPVDEPDLSDTSIPKEEDSQTIDPEDVQKQVKIELPSQKYHRNELTLEQWNKANELERREYNKLLNEPWYLQLSPVVQEAIKNYPPFNLYKLQSGHVCYITEYHQPVGDYNAPVSCTIAVSTEYNGGKAAFRDETGEFITMIKKGFGVPLNELTNIGLRSVFDAKKYLEEQAALPFTAQINTRKGQLERSRRQQLIKRLGGGK